MATLIFLDSETTGKNSVIHGILSLGLVIEKDSEVILEEEILIQSENKLVSEEAMRVNGIHLDQHNKEAMPRSEASIYILSLLREYRGSTLVGHKISFDLKFLNALFGGVGVDWDDGLHLYRQIDTMHVSRFLKNAGILSSRGNGLESLARSLGILKENEHQTHRALDDAHLLREVYHGLIRLVNPPSDISGGIYP